MNAALEDAFAFMDGVVVPHVFEQVERPVVNFRELGLGIFEASAQQHSNKQYSIWVDSSVPKHLYGLFEAVDPSVCELAKVHLSEVTAFSESADHAQSMIFHSALVFLVLHELSHIALGHLDAHRWFLNTEFPKGHELSEGNWASDTKQYAYFRRHLEFEADGYATRLLLRFLPFVSVACGVDSNLKTSNSFSVRSALIGIMLVMSKLEFVSRSSKNKENPCYPFPGARILNICSAYTGIVAPELREWRAGQLVVRPATKEQAEAVAQDYQETIIPAVYTVHSALSRLGEASLFAFPSQRIEETPIFMQDVLKSLSNSAPGASTLGQQFALQHQYREQHLELLKPFRIQGVW